jgi:hypothetical protein
LCRGPPPDRSGGRDCAAGVRPWHGERPRHGGRHGAQLPGKNVGRDADGVAAAARDRGPYGIVCGAWPVRIGPGCAPGGVYAESFPVCDQFPVALPTWAGEASPLPVRVTRLPATGLGRAL